ncbi:MAG TPA: triphosphoribosyl-dephospho-CoA synthase MdcB [Steroidobacteraceae bacterium]
MTRSNACRSHISVFRESERIGTVAGVCLKLEVETYPKPGLVSRVDSGAHRDMDAALLIRSADALVPFFIDLASAGAAGMDMGRLRVIGLAAEKAMLLATAGVNTHRGAIFGLGLLCAAAAFRAHRRMAVPLGRIVSSCCGADILRGPIPLHSHGTIVARRYAVGGARREAADGFPSIYRTALPILQKIAIELPNDPEAARVQACMALISTVEDTNLLYRGGQSGLAYARERAREFLDRGGVMRADWRVPAAKIHAELVSRNLSPGGCADLLAMSLFVQKVSG